MTETQTIIAQPLTREAFAPFGEIIEKQNAESFLINEGNCRRFHDLASVNCLGENAKTLINIFQGTAYKTPLNLKLVERHPLGSQAFMPLGGLPYLVIVCADENGIPGAPKAFLARGDQGVSYPPNQWHGVLAPVGKNQDFIVVDRGGDGNNLEEYYFDAPWRVEIESYEGN